MKVLNQFRTKLILFLISGILFVSFGFIFIIISCGTGPTLKVSDTNKGAYAIDFSLAPNDNAYILASSDNFPSIANKEFTIEAWVKPQNSSVKSPIFTHADSNKGILIYLYDNVLKARIGYGQVTSTGISSGAPAFSPGEWKHVTVVLTNQDHNGVHPACGGAESEDWHLDFYVDGTFTGCSSTSGNYAHDPTEQTSDGYIYKNGAIIGYESVVPLVPMTVTDGTFGKFNAAIDDVRFWLTARSSTEINQCNDNILGLTPPCNIDSTILKGYWPLNEGAGTLATDISGSGINGTINSPTNALWDGGWVTGKY